MVDSSHIVAAVAAAADAGAPLTGGAKGRPTAATVAARKLGIPRSTAQDAWARHTAAAAKEDEDPSAAARARRLAAANRRLREDAATADDIASRVFGIRSDGPASVRLRDNHTDPASTPTAESTPFLICSDWQLGEVIRSDELLGINAFDQHIAEERVGVLFTEAVAARRRVNAPHSRIVLGVVGDMISGEIHAELAETNDLSSAPAVRQCVGLLRDGIEQLCEAYGRVHVVIVQGNHDRTTFKPRGKQYSNLSYGAIMGWWLQDLFRRDDRVSFQQPDGSDAVVTVHGRRILMTHGDRIGSRGGQGFIGPLATIIRGHAKVHMQYADLGTPIDYVVNGHFHTSALLPTGVANGCLPGYSEYAHSFRGRPEAAQQAMFWVTGRYGMWAYSSIRLAPDPIVGAGAHIVEID